ncbi:patatin-like phospholipase domain-containing protein [Aspergillus vadensis CBS 113365]|uniref:Patatin-like phospholipase domain-containing protein n=1 Tax=Aspergillus vadensis (strain CBS 113365 / IMI 142717 / IBT 24658) TaxID=1448311 RepID=A0A319AW64_ASPVC|nr:patatin-like serine hydrolase [Aspergillus vadensis CBS 113365]PYH64606.1 patatin-like serine hydrolase [Aspergillus vadensis CBS 113365]
MNGAEKSAAGDTYDPSTIPDYDREFINPDDLRQFELALTDQGASPLVALNDWRPIYQRVRRERGRRKEPRRTKDETREGVLYTVLKWPFLFTVFGWITALAVAYTLTRVYIFLYEQWVTWRGRRQSLRRQLRAQTNYPDWQKAARALDDHLGNQRWKEIDEYAYYDHLTISNLVKQLKKVRREVERERREKRRGSGQSPAAEELCTLLEACVKNNFAGVENPRLYSEAYSGTKNLVQEYIDELHACIQLVADSKGISSEEKLQHFKHLDTNFGRTALCLSGGATFAYYHFGVVRALLDNGVLPEIITGTSGGALVAALVATRTDEELKQLLVPALAHRIRACQESFPTWVWRWWRTGARFDTLDWARQCSWFCRGSTTFREAYERTGRILNVSCVPSDPHSPTILANYLTSPNCVIWSAVLASAAVPGILNPVVLMTKKRDGTLAPYSFGHKWKDGSLRTDIPIKALNLHFNVNFTIVSQVNPHINLFFFSSRGTVGRPVTHRKGRGWRGGFLGSAIEQYIKLDMNKWLRVLRHLELLPRPMGQDWSEIWLQKFSGTVTIWPKTVPSDFFHILSDPNPERLARMLRVGQQSAFPKLQFIKNRLKIEIAVVKSLQKFAHAGGRPISPAPSRWRQNNDPDIHYNPSPRTATDPLNERLDHNLPGRRGDNVNITFGEGGGSGEDAHLLDGSLSENSSNESAGRPTSSASSSRLLRVPEHRRGSTGSSIFEEMRRQSAVFFDDVDMYGDDEALRPG